MKNITVTIETTLGEVNVPFIGTFEVIRKPRNGTEYVNLFGEIISYKGTNKNNFNITITKIKASDYNTLVAHLDRQEFTLQYSTDVDELETVVCKLSENGISTGKLKFYNGVAYYSDVSFSCKEV